jgi:hypothetical protein
MTVLAQGRHPQIFVLGDADWQIVLADHRSGRVLILLGDFPESPGSDVDHIMSAFRPRVDVLIGTGSSLASLPPDFAKNRAVSHIIQVDEPDGLGASPSFSPLAGSLEVHVGPFRVALEQIPGQAGSLQGESGERWIGHIGCDGVWVAVAPGLDVIASHGRLDSALAVAPRGMPEAAWSVVPRAGIAVNGASVRGWTADEIDSTNQPRYLVRTFPRDVAAFPIQDGRIGLPGWAQRIHQGPGG